MNIRDFRHFCDILYANSHFVIHDETSNRLFLNSSLNKTVKMPSNRANPFNLHSKSHYARLSDKNNLYKGSNLLYLIFCLCAWVCLHVICIDVNAIFSGILCFKSNFVWLFYDARAYRTFLSVDIRTLFTLIIIVTIIVHSFLCYFPFCVCVRVLVQQHDFMVILRFMAHSIRFTISMQTIFFKQNKMKIVQIIMEKRILYTKWIA